MNYLIPSCSHILNGINEMPLENTHLIEWCIDDDAPSSSEVPGNNLGDPEQRSPCIMPKKD
jgi:hypothetical protein